MSDTMLMPQTSLWANRKCLLICTVVSIANMQYGLDLAAVGGLQAMPGFLIVFGYPDPSSAGGYAIDGTFQQLITSLLTLGSFLSSLTAGVFAHFYGRKTALWTACMLNVVACIIQIAAEDQGAVYVGRLILGFANGFLVTFSNIYTSEASPAHLRAVIVALFAYWVNIGSIIGAAVTNAVKNRLDKASYQIPLGTLFIVPLFLTVGLCFVPESPRYLLNKGKTGQARRALETLRGDSLSAEHLEFEWAEMVKGIEEEKRLATTVGALDMFKNSDLRRTLLCYGMIACQTASGIWFLISYATYFMIVGGLSVDEAFKFSVMNTCVGFIGVNVGMVAMRHLAGRRTVLMFGAAFCGVCMLALAVAASVATSTVVQQRDCLIAFTALFFFGYNSCVGAASYPVATELVSTRLRSWTVGTATSLGYFLAWLTAFCTPYFINPGEMDWGAKYGYIWAAANFLCMGFFFFCMPELKGRTLEEIDELFLNNVSVANFPKYRTAIGDAAAQEVKDHGGLSGQKAGGATEHVEHVQ
ncbi:general substrate transporter [Diplodia corticola]|uniref:General substrate transporter n=1 Tax=Diplodia corticola TaxID=236234 RepID=A0A1J9RGN7_9PEZI|nr:general substrate transporter [Diplodia corticola]OJD31699.1 general substrate transporter [Diplodia corticola]